MEHFRPVFRHFFLEKFPDPAVWFERRLTYTRSVAISSIGDNAVDYQGKFTNSGKASLNTIGLKLNLSSQLQPMRCHNQFNILFTISDSHV